MSRTIIDEDPRKLFNYIQENTSIQFSYPFLRINDKSKKYLSLKEQKAYKIVVKLAKIFAIVMALGLSTALVLGLLKKQLSEKSFYITIIFISFFCGIVCLGVLIILGLTVGVMESRYKRQDNDGEILRMMDTRLLKDGTLIQMIPCQTTGCQILAEQKGNFSWHLSPMSGSILLGFSDVKIIKKIYKVMKKNDKICIYALVLHRFLVFPSTTEIKHSDLDDCFFYSEKEERLGLSWYTEIEPKEKLMEIIETNIKNNQ